MKPTFACVCRPERRDNRQALGAAQRHASKHVAEGTVMIAQPEARGEPDARPTNGDARKRTTSAATNVDGGQRIAFRAQMPAPPTQPFPLTTFCFPPQCAAEAAITIKSSIISPALYAAEDEGHARRTSRPLEPSLSAQPSRSDRRAEPPLLSRTPGIQARLRLPCLCRAHPLGACW